LGVKPKSGGTAKRGAEASGRAKVTSSRVVFTSPIFGVRRDKVIEPGAVHTTRYIVTHGGSVVLLPVFPDGRILLVRQYRHTVGKFMWELSAGRREPGEGWRAAAQRELREETGFRARDLRRLLEVSPSPGFVAERLVIYIARNLQPDPAAQDVDERITTRYFTLADLLRWIRAGKISDAKSVSGILYYARFGSRSH
jgi:8-oxo-dGTP pyrophosphatase MutT (NUDIX family)